MAGRDENIPSIDRTLLLIAADLPDISLQDGAPLGSFIYFLPCSFLECHLLLSTSLPVIAAFGISKTAASVFLEAVGEYARLLYDLFPQALVRVPFGLLASPSLRPARSLPSPICGSG